MNNILFYYLISLLCNCIAFIIFIVSRDKCLITILGLIIIINLTFIYLVYNKIYKYEYIFNILEISYIILFILYIIVITKRLKILKYF
jgi:hypothetical protein